MTWLGAPSRREKEEIGESLPATLVPKTAHDDDEDYLWPNLQPFNKIYNYFYPSKVKYDLR